MNPTRNIGMLAILLAMISGTPDSGAADAAAPESAQSPGALKSVSEFESRKHEVDPESLPGAAVYHRACAACHEGQVPKAPHKMFLQMMSGQTIDNALTGGLMATQGRILSAGERAQVAEYLSGAPVAAAAAHAVPPVCSGPSAAFDAARGPLHSGWGYDNARFVGAADAGIGSANAGRLHLKWALEYPGGIRARSQPSIAYGAVYVGSYDGTVYALDLATGCVRWTFKAGAEVRTAVVPYEAITAGADGRHAARVVFGDVIARVYSVDAFTGRLQWSAKVDDHANATLTGSPTFHDGSVYVPVSSLEVTSAADPNYECCKFRGSVVALDAWSGARRWKSWSIPTAPAPVKKRPDGRSTYAPSGAPIWNSPTIDARRGVLYVGTGENYSSPANETSDAVLAIRLRDGRLLWSRQMLAGDAWNVGCMMATDHVNCPKENGPDFDFGAGTILVPLANGRRVLVAGQKNGWVYGLDPDARGKELWRTRVARGGIQGGVHFGMAAEALRLYAPVSDMKEEHNGRTLPGAPRPGLNAIDAATGRILWSMPAADVCAGREYCDPGVSAAVTAVPGAVIAGHMDGRLRIYDGSNGNLLWEYDSTQDVTTVSGAKAHGGSFGGAGAAVRDGYLAVNSGYGLYFHMPGNLLLVFSVD
jgi:polyvinyl alcohol dehydrogenase (cytochrome)